MSLKKKIKKLTKKRGTDTPWMDSMSNQYSEQPHRQQDGSSGANNKPSEPQPTVAAFSPNQQTASRTGNRSSLLIHQKSPLLVATPPQVTRALAYSHAFILPLNHVAGLLSWTTSDAWESFLLLAGFWFTVLYGDDVTRWAGPLVVVVGLILGMYSRRYSPLSSTVWSGEKAAKHKRAKSEERKSLDEILETLRTFTGRCDVLLDPCLRLTDFLSTQSSATSATTRPALTTLFIRLLAFMPIWILLTLPPFYIITTKRIVLTLGTLGLTWHSRPARVTRTLLWRSRTVRNTLSLLTGLQFLASTTPTNITPPPLPPRGKAASANALNAKGAGPGIRFTFTTYENQRRWLGLGWTANLLAYERQAWTDEHHNTCPDPDHFELPDTDHETTKWRWVPGSDWHVEGAMTEKEKSAKRIGGGGGGDDCGWVYYDNKWHDGRKTDGWGRYTRRRKWLRDAELVEIGSEEPTAPSEAGTESTVVPENDTTDSTSIDSTAKRKGWFGGGGGGSGKKGPHRPTMSDRSDAVSKTGSVESTRSRDGPDDDVHTPLRYRQTDWDRSIGDGVEMGLS